MCGLAGILTAPSAVPGELEFRMGAMTRTLVHRGPDDEGVWTDPAAGVALGFRRLSIIDLSPLGHQPMFSASGRYVMVFNGEVYNFSTIRRELEAKGTPFRGHSDSEVILGAFEEWGITEAVKRFVGMFAIAVWDTRRRELTLFRDRLGIKPMFVHAGAGLILFGSELKALCAHPEFDRTVDPVALTAYLRYLYVPAPRSIYRNTIKLPPGHLLTIRSAGEPLPAPISYWSPEAVAHAGVDHPFEGDDEEAVGELHRLLREAVGLRLQADVPLGALLSGGVDSSAVVALMQSQTNQPVRTFTIGFDELHFDEAAHARAVAGHLGTRHTELQLTGDDALALVPRLPEMFDEPLADPSQLPTYLVCELARRDVTVALTGDGGDEVFAGYNRYLQGERWISSADSWPRGLRRLSSTALSSLRPGTWDRLARTLHPVLPSAAQGRLLGEKLHKIAALLREDSAVEMYRSLLSARARPGAILSSPFVEDNGPVEKILGNGGSLGLMERMMLADQMGYLTDDLLAKVDRASMAVSLEARVPLLDHRVVEFSWRLPRRLKVRDGRGKWILRQVLYQHVPPALVDREKMGFSVPIAQWLKGPLRGWSEDMLSGPDALLDTHAVRSEWNRFLGGEEDLGMGLWAILVYRAWSRVMMGTPRV